MAIPVKPSSRQQAWLMPPTLDDLVPEDHPVRFAAAFVDGLDAEAWEEEGPNHTNLTDEDAALLNISAGLWPAQRVARRRALPAQRPQQRGVGIAPAVHRVQSQEPPRGVEVWSQPRVPLWGRSAAPTEALPDRRTPPSPAPTPSLSPFCSCHPPSDCVPHPTHHAPYQSNETASEGEEVCRSD